MMPSLSSLAFSVKNAKDEPLTEVLTAVSPNPTAVSVCVSTVSSEIISSVLDSSDEIMPEDFVDFENISFEDEEFSFSEPPNLQGTIYAYDPHDLPEEFKNRSTQEFLEDKNGVSLPQIHRDILIRICQFLNPKDYLEVSLTCRFLHWRIFTFCSCTWPADEFVVCAEKINSKSVYGPKVIFSPAITPQMNRGQIFYPSFTVVIRGKKDNFDPCLGLVTCYLEPLRSSIGHLSVIFLVKNKVTMRPDYDPDHEYVCSITWDTFLQTMQADFVAAFVNKVDKTTGGLFGYPFYPAILDHPYIKKMKCAYLGIRSKDILIHNMRRTKLKNPHGKYYNIPSFLIDSEVKQFLAGNTTYRSRSFQLSPMVRKSVIELIEFENLGVTFEKNPQGEMVAVLGAEKRKRIIIPPHGRSLALYSDFAYHAEIKRYDKIVENAFRIARSK